MTNFDIRISPDIVAYTREATAQAREVITRAYEGESRAELMGLTEDKAAAFEGFSAPATIPLAEFDRTSDSERRAEKTYRRLLLPGVLRSVCGDFTLYHDAIEEPADFSTIASLALPTRTIDVLRTLGSSQATSDNIHACPNKFQDRELLPAHVIYRLLVADTTLR